MKYNYLKRDLSSLQIQNYLFQKKTIFLICIFKSLPSNIKSFFITKAASKTIEDLINNNSYSIKYPIFNIRIKNQKPLTISFLLTKFFSNNKIKEITIFFKILNLYFLEYKQFLSSFTVIKTLRAFCLNLNANFLTNNFFLLLYG
jgi:hypothetical protein